MTPPCHPALDRSPWLTFPGARFRGEDQVAWRLSMNEAPISGAAHVPVLLQRCCDLLEPALAPGATIVDGTLGMGGHSEALLSRNPDLRLIGIDRDPAALELAADRLGRFADRIHLVHARYDEIDTVLESLHVDAVAGILLDLGVSSLQLDSDDRGFAYSRDTALDMRMDPTVGQTAADVLATYTAGELTRIFRQYGEERFAQRIAARIVTFRGRTALTSTGQLVEIVRSGIPAAARRTGGNPAKRVFQALRIEVNGELDGLRAALPAAFDSLEIGGRIVVMAYQSLEDRLVKRAIAARTASQLPVDLPVQAVDIRPEFESLTRGAEQASAAEIAENPRATSVRLRAACRLRAAA